MTPCRQIESVSSRLQLHGLVWSGLVGLAWSGLSSKKPAWGMARESPRRLLHGAACDVSLNAIDSHDEGTQSIENIVLLF